MKVYFCIHSTCALQKAKVRNPDLYHFQCERCAETLTGQHRQAVVILKTTSLLTASWWLVTSVLTVFVSVTEDDAAGEALSAPAEKALARPRATTADLVATVRAVEMAVAANRDRMTSTAIAEEHWRRVVLNDRQRIMSKGYRTA